MELGLLTQVHEKDGDQVLPNAAFAEYPDEVSIVLLGVRKEAIVRLKRCLLSIMAADVIDKNLIFPNSQLFDIYHRGLAGRNDDLVPVLGVCGAPGREFSAQNTPIMPFLQHIRFRGT